LESIKASKAHFAWLDNLKAFGIIAVILGHIANPFGAFIFSWHMPLFFMMAGFFIKINATLPKLIQRDFKRLMLPYFIFGILGVVLEFVKRIVLNREVFVWGEELVGLFFWMDMQSLRNTYGFVLWFLPTLFFARLILYIIFKNITREFVRFIAIIILFSISFFVNLPFAIDEALNAVLFVYLGYLTFNYYLPGKMLFIFAIFTALGISIFYGIPTLDMATKNYQNITLNIFFSVAVVLSLIFVFKLFEFKSNLVSLWGGATMVLFIIHPYTNNIAHIIVEFLSFGGWLLKLAISLLLLQLVLFIQGKMSGRGLFKYV
jgi:fucose 4-O-acetylase-like acetyltransferase